MAQSGQLHEDFSRRESARGSSDRSFGLVMAAGFAVVGLLPLVRHHPMRPWALVVAAVFLVAALVRPGALTLLNRGWLAFASLIQRVVTPVVMAALFFLVLTPIAMIRRALGKRAFAQTLDRSASSYWVVRTPPGPAPESIKNQF